MEKIRIGIVGYGNLGRGVETALERTQDMELVAVFTRRDPDSLKLAAADVPVRSLDQIVKYQERLDVLILCGGSKSDIPEQGPALAAHFNTVDSFDTHAKIPEYFAQVDASARSGGNLSLIAVGWDPGVFSLNRLFGEAILPDGKTETFWGKGVSQGHSDAVRRVPGVKAAVQYTLPVEAVVEQVREGRMRAFLTREKHQRQCYVVLEEGADPEEVERAIVTMPDYFADYDTTVEFISQDVLDRDHAAMPHGGFVIRSGETGTGNAQVVEYALRLGSNPEFTASVLVAYARAAYRLHSAGETGARTVLDVPPALLSPKSGETLRRELL